MSNHVNVSRNESLIVIAITEDDQTVELPVTPERAIRAAQLLEAGQGACIGIRGIRTEADGVEAAAPGTLTLITESLTATIELPEASAARLAASLRGCAYAICDARYVGVVDDTVTVVRYRSGQLATLWHEEYGWCAIDDAAARELVRQLEIALAA